jgi:hypothetical protein
MLRQAQHDSGVVDFFVTLSLSKGDAGSDPMLRQAQHDNSDAPLLSHPEPVEG